MLTHTTRAWRRKYIHGFTPIAGNFSGQGSLYSIVFTGLNIENFSSPTTKANALSSARMYLSSPASYMSAADPAVFGRREGVNHFALPSDPKLLDRLVAALRRPRSRCL